MVGDCEQKTKQKHTQVHTNIYTHTSTHMIWAPAQHAPASAVSLHIRHKAFREQRAAPRFWQAR